MDISKVSCAIAFAVAAFGAHAAEEPKQSDYARCFPTAQSDSVMGNHGLTKRTDFNGDALHEYKTADSGITAYVYDFPSKESCVIGAGVRDTDPVQLKKFYDLKLDQLHAPRQPQ